MKITGWIAVFSVAASFMSCKQPAPADIVAAADSSQDDQIVMGLLYQQRAAEYHALSLQSYQVARERLDEALKDHVPHPAVITDLDETALDNSADEAWLYQHDSSYTP